MTFKKMRKTAGGLLTLALISCCLISGTLAKYTTKVEASDTARVAKFDVKPGTDEEFKFNLFGTVLDTKKNGWTSITAYEEDVWSNAKDTVIAPGTKGRFYIQLENRSEVSVGYEIRFSEYNPANVPLQYSLDGSNWVSDINDLRITGEFRGLSNLYPHSKPIYWRWPYEGHDNYRQSDAADTLLGEGGTAIMEVISTITFTQID